MFRDSRKSWQESAKRQHTLKKSQKHNMNTASKCSVFLLQHIHSFILETYVAPLQDTTTLRRSQPSHSQRRRTSGRCKIWKGRSSARNAAQQGDHSMPMGDHSKSMGPQPKRPFSAQLLNGPEEPKAHSRTQHPTCFHN